MSTPSSIADFLNRLGPVAVAKLDAYPIKTNVERSVTGDMVNSALQDFANLVADLLSQKQGVLTFDNTPAAGSSNPVTSAGIAAAITNQIAAALVGYMTQPQVAAAITAALAPYSTTAQTAQQIASAIAAALADYSTTAQMQTAIGDAINTALAAYDTHAEVVQEIADAITAALTDYVTGEQMTEAIAAALADYVTTAAMNTALAGKQDKLTAMGSTTKPVYVYADGTLAPCDDYAGGTKVVLNGEDKGGKSISIYAPTGKGNAEQYYGSKAPDAPGWVTPDNAPTEGSGKLVKSGGIFAAIANAVTGAINTVKTWAEGLFAKIDGYYQTLTAGAAENLVGRGTTPAVISFRPAGGTQDIGTGAASFAKIKGRTDAWNQGTSNLLHNVGNCTYTTSGDDTTFTRTDANTAADVYLERVPIIAGHKYLFLVEVQANQNIIYEVAEGGQPAFIYDSITPTKFTQYSGIHQAVASTYLAIHFRIGTSNTDGTMKIRRRHRVYDLTLQYGAGREPATAAAFLAEYPEALTAPYNAGKLVNNKVTALVTSGYNLYNPANGEAHLVANQKIQICGTYTGATIDGEAVVFDANGYFTPTRDCVMVVAGGNATDTDVHFSHSGIRDYGTANYQYEPYWTATLNIDHSKIYGKLEGAGEMVQIAPNGFRGVGENCDEVDIVRKEAYIRRAWMDMGTLNWNYISGQGFFQTGAITPAIAPTATQSVANILTYKYLAASSYDVYNGVKDKAIAVSNDPVLRVRDSAYSDAATFKAAMVGVYADVELATPLHYTDLMYSEDGGQTFVEIPSNYRVDDFGTERRLPDGLVDGAPASTPLVADIAYAMNAVDTLRRLPQTYLSKESTENLLAALQSAGVIAGYTMTYDDTNEQYDFTITPNA